MTWRKIQLTEWWWRFEADDSGSLTCLSILSTSRIDLVPAMFVFAQMIARLLFDASTFVSFMACSSPESYQDCYLVYQDSYIADFL
jgi:hypothetical protein